jgi:ABC-type bacteriocin/lantibiotic exporter with double-glycine peptidase domain
MNEKISCDKFDHYTRSLANQPNHAQFKDFQKHEKEGWCGPACLAWIAQQEGLFYTQAQLARIMGTTSEDGTSHEQMIRGAQEIGLRVFRLQGHHIEGLSELLPTHHIVVNWMDGPNDNDDGHYSILKDFVNGLVHLEDRVLDAEKFNEKWYDSEKEGRVDRWAMIVLKKK